MKLTDIESIELVEDHSTMDGWDYNDPQKEIAGWYIDGNGKKCMISLNDEYALQLANEQKTDSIFQFDTPLAKCCRFDSKVNTEAGLIEIHNLDQAKHKILYLHNDGLKYTNNYQVVCSGIKNIFKLDLSDGTCLQLTADHRVLTTRGFVCVKDLTKDDEIIEESDHEFHSEVKQNSSF